MKYNFADMFEDRPFPDENLCDDITTLDEDDIESLIKILTDRSLLDHDNTSFFPYHAAHILSYFKVNEAIPELIRLLDDSAFEYTPDLANILAFHREKITDILVERYSMASTTNKDNYALVLSESGVKNEKVFSILIEHLQSESDLSPIYLAEYGDPKAIAALSKRFDEFKVDMKNLLGNQLLIEIDAAISDLGGDLNPDQKKKLKKAKKQSKVISEKFFRKIGRSIINIGKKTGRNDPCNCGSGKKYKKCCLNSEHSIPF